jgi:hypothetical protein
MTTGKQQVEPDKLRMDEGEFDRIMRKALQVKPNDGKPKKAKPGKTAKPKKIGTTQ